MSRMRLGNALLLLVLGLTTEASAHHSFNFIAADEGDRFVTGEGTISEVRLVNPHSGLFIDTGSGNGDGEVWGIETRPAVYLLRRGWSPETLQAGQKVTFAAERLRERNRGWWRAVLVHGATPDDKARLFIEIESLDQGETAAFRARFESLPPCEGISEFCYRVSSEALATLLAEYGEEGYLTPSPSTQ